ncbi:MAG: hypothetical protein DMG26_19890 [Acidobacteria bacterium]|nr:MAG: hypothetical protein DMG26_19890 [Acidobacteriota bacterium]
MRKLVWSFLLLVLPGVWGRAEDVRIEDLQDKTVLVFTPHPDDELWGAGGTIASLNRNHNRVFIVLYTNDDKGSYDLEMTSQRLGRIRKAEEEAAESVLGTPRENLIWMGYDDGMLEYAPQPKLVEEATRGSGTSAGTRPITAWRRSTPSTRCAPPSSGSTSRINFFSRT